MGGRIIGFLTGVSTVGVLHYYTRSLFEVNKHFTSNVRSMVDQVNDQILSDRGIDKNPTPPNRRERQLSRASFVETSKDIWNEELIKSVNWLYSINWYRFGLDLDRKASKFLDKITHKLIQNENDSK